MAFLSETEHYEVSDKTKALNKKIEKDNEKSVHTGTLHINEGDPFIEQDLSAIIHVFEKESQNWSETDYSNAFFYRDVYSTEHFSQRSREHLALYPGMHNNNNLKESSEEDFYRNKPKSSAESRLKSWDEAMGSQDLFMNNIKTRESDWTWGDVIAPDSLDKGKKNALKMLNQCVPCFDRVLDGASVLPNGDFIKIHMLNMKLKMDAIDKIMHLFKNTDMEIDICALLDVFSKMCPQDMLSILSLLTQYLAKLNLEINFNLNFVLELVGPMLSPFLSELNGWLDQWIQVFIGPLTCIIDHINEVIIISQTAKIPFQAINNDMSVSTNAALPFQKNTINNANVSAGVSATDRSAGFTPGYSTELFSTPDERMYMMGDNAITKDEIPSMSKDEIKTSFEEGIADYRKTDTEEKEQKRREIFNKEREKYEEKMNAEKTKAAMHSASGGRWKRDPENNIAGKSNEVLMGHMPPEKTDKFLIPSQYYVTEPITHSVIELRNIIQAGVRYIQDWVDFANQMVYDILGTDFGWINNKTSTAILKSRIIQMIYFIKAIGEAMAKNGLKCGSDTNLSEKDTKDLIFKFLNNKYPDGSFSESNGELIFKRHTPLVEDDSDSTDTVKDNTETTIKNGFENIRLKTLTQDPVIIKKCSKAIDAKQMDVLKKWLSDFENFGGIDD